MWDKIEHLLRQLLTPMPAAQITVLRIVVIALAIGMFAAWKGWLKGARGAWWVTLGATVCATLIATLAMRIGDRPPAGTSREVLLDPFEGFKRAALLNGTRVETANFYGNILLFIPLGVCVAMLTYGWLIARVGLAWLMGAVLSASIELTQSTMDRVVDVNDIILNSSGALAGGVLVALWVGLKERPTTNKPVVDLGSR